MADGTVRINFQANVDDVKRGSRETIRELDRVNKAAGRSSSAAASSSAKALTGISRMFATGKTSIKSFEKVGRSAASSLTAVSGVAAGVGAAFGIAVPAAAALAVSAIKTIQEANRSLTSRINESAAAFRTMTVASLASGGALDAITLADIAAADAHQKLNDARKKGNLTTSEMLQLEIGARNADRDATTSRITSAEAIVKQKEATNKYVDSISNVIDHSRVMKQATVGGRGAFEDQAASAVKAAGALRNHAQSAEGLTGAERDAEVALAGYIETTGRVPDDIKTVVKLLGQGKSYDDIRRYLGILNSVPRRILTILATRKVGPGGVGGPSGTGLATGGVIAGRFDGKDDVPINVSRGEVVLNPMQQRAVNRGASIGQALRGAPVVRAGGSFAGGGRSDRSMDQFLGGSVLDRLAMAASTLDEGDDRSAAGLARDRISRILDAKKFGKGKYARKLTPTERRMLLEALGGYRRDALSPATTDPGGGAGTGVAAAEDPFALSRAESAGFNAGRGRLEGYVFGGSGDIGAGGASALGAAGSIPMLHVENLSFTNSPQNQGQIAGAGNTGNALLNRGRIYAPRTGVSF